MRRTDRITVNYTPTEIAAVRDRARAVGRTLSVFVRETSLGAAHHTRRHRTIDELIRHLARIGHDLTLLTPGSASQLDATLTELRSLIRRLVTIGDGDHGP